uniref:Cytochrome c oxidase subunit 3 n=1 Tax=Isodiametra pulchra TaxID=504439 RepID=A0A1X9WDA3_ISOPU|nr:cytochrome c oxidase subunit III [Isodiametra pulchra]ARS00906.1 cytochrome c oxidase subunit 3 [Isodiametra pulchra]
MILPPFQFNTQPFHLVEESPWPFYLGTVSFFFLLSLIDYFWFSSWNLIFAFVMLILTLKVWSRDIIRESVFLGGHSAEAETNFKWGMGWFISSEVFFFLAFFWAFFHFSLVPNIETGNVWPPIGISPMAPFAIPLLNTMLLLSSGISLTWCHHSVLQADFSSSMFGIILTIFLGVYFTLLQIFEYQESFFCFNDSLYGSIFFLATGFHGFHVLMGTMLLVIVGIRIWQGNFSPTHHIGLEVSSWYWHFVDVVWLFLFCCIYWWGG